MSEKNPTVLSGLMFVPQEELHLDARSQAISVGASVAEGLRAYWNDAHKQLEYGQNESCAAGPHLAVWASSWTV